MAPPSESTASVEAAGRRHQNRHANTDTLTQAGPPDHGLTSPPSPREQEAANLLPNRTQLHLLPSITCQDPPELFLPRGSAAAKRRRVTEASRTSCCLRDEPPLRWVRNVARSGLHVHRSALLVCVCVWRCLHVHGCPAAPPVSPLYSF